MTAEVGEDVDFEFSDAGEGFCAVEDLEGAEEVGVGFGGGW